MKADISADEGRSEPDSKVIFNPEGAVIERLDRSFAPLRVYNREIGACEKKSVNNKQQQVFYDKIEIKTKEAC